MDNMHQTLQWSLLHDFYGGLLTEHQSEIFNLYHGMDLSLGEIAEQFEVSRQAVYDILKRSEKALLELEERLGLLAKSEEQRRIIQEIRQELDPLRGGDKDQPITNRVDKICELLDKL